MDFGFFFLVVQENTGLEWGSGTKSGEQETIVAIQVRDGDVFLNVFFRDESGISHLKSGL